MPPSSYPLIIKMSHWVSAIFIVGLFIMGIWMVDLSYYDTWYHKAPELHKDIGLLLALLTLIRFVSKYLTKQPQPLAQSSLLMLATKIVHLSMYFLLIVMFVSGYLIFTAEGKDIVWFEQLTIPAIITLTEDQADFNGDLHLWSAYILIGLALMHVAAVIKHQIFDRVSIIKRML